MAPPAVTASEQQRRFGRTVVTFVTLGFVALIAAATATALVVARGQTEARWVAHTYQVQGQFELISRQAATMRAEAVVAAFLHRRKSSQYYVAETGLFRAIDRVAQLVGDNPRQKARIPILRQNYLVFKEMLDPPMGQDFEERVNRVEEVRKSLIPLRQQIADEENALLKIRLEDSAASARRFWIVLPLSGVLLLVVAIASVLAIRRFTGELARSKDDLQAMNEGLEMAVDVRTRDLQRANEEIQRFAYIVSHDLRSPLVNVMGFTAELDASRKHLERLITAAEETTPEIVTNDMKIAVREDLPEAIGFIRSSTQRMDRLINAILRLSREGRRTLLPERLDTTAIVQNSVDSMRHRIDDAGAAVKIEGPLPAIASDRVAFEQILSNLIENAVKYLKPGRPGDVTIRGSAHLGRATFEVIDNGRGIDPHDHERIFDLFRRSGVQDQPGEGIGLAHVRALAHRLGGTVDVVSQLDKGATFKVILPVVYTGDKDKPA